jgi:hypothetical protein
VIGDALVADEFPCIGNLMAIVEVLQYCSHGILYMLRFATQMANFLLLNAIQKYQPSSICLISKTIKTDGSKWRIWHDRCINNIATVKPPRRGAVAVVSHLKAVPYIRSLPCDTHIPEPPTL